MKDRSGQRKGRLVFQWPIGRNQNSKIIYLALCDCGNLHVTGWQGCESCGCLWRERNRAPKPHSEEHSRKISEVKSRKDTLHICKQCSKEFFGTKTQLFCSIKHQKDFSSRYWLGSGKRARRITRKTGAKYEPISFWTLYARDNGCCQVCSKELLREFRGDPRNPLAPTHGHIIPLARGGDHTYANSQLECLGCNLAKIDRMPEGIAEPKTNPDLRTRVEKIRDAAVAQWADPIKRATLLVAFARRKCGSRGMFERNE